jgi:hypothetical protein
MGKAQSCGNEGGAYAEDPEKHSEAPSRRRRMFRSRGIRSHPTVANR